MTALKNSIQKDISPKSKRDFIDISDNDTQTLREILDSAKNVKQKLKSGGHPEYLKGNQLAMIFEKASTRTRVSFEVGINQLGGNALYLSSDRTQIGRGEPVQDTAGVLSRYVDLIMIRTFEHEKLKDLAKNSSVPVINGLTDYSHPCQILADILTIEEKLGDIKGKTITWIGDVNNMLTSWVEAAEKFDFELRVSCPKQYEPNIAYNKNVKYFENPLDACKNADVITTDTWVSMGDADAEQKMKILADYQVTQALLDNAKDESIFLHCLPAHRGEEVTAEVIDGKKSVIYDEAENRLHIQKAIMLWCLGIRD